MLDTRLPVSTGAATEPRRAYAWAMPAAGAPNAGVRGRVLRHTVDGHIDLVPPSAARSEDAR